MRKLAQLIILITISTLLIRCQDKSNIHCKPQEYSYLTITDEAKSKVPYLKHSFDTVSYANNKGDTLVFVSQPKDSSWYCTPSYPNTDCLPDYYCYENYGAKYTCIKGNGSFEFKHALKAELSVGSPPNIKEYNRILCFTFSNIKLLLNDYLIGKKEYINYLNSVTINNKKYNDVIYTYNNNNDSTSGKGYYNSEYGLFSIEDRNNNTNWILISK